ncbi:transcription factor IIIB 60 kDa subunit-like isoform X2 [Rutidosis leptorrhynchoides]|uniref:transcription factor IIIB 60 kDa subunit-like isoform X2 n=1 Tax=Rutidosis leptorrhynchoides TaxID=125765 RepID=UPI003A9921B4
MTWCVHCAKNSEPYRDYSTGTVSCVDCGRVISQDLYTEDATFVKDSSGGAHLSGNLIKIGSSCGESHRRTLEKGYAIIDQLVDKYGIRNVNHAAKYYEIAVERNFTKGRRRSLVAAACLYLACREQDKAFLLIEFSSELAVSVLLNFHNHPFVQKPVDPSLFMYRYTSELIEGDGRTNVLNTALHLVVSMKRDWIQTGRKPSGICAAAIYVSSVLHGYNFSRSDVVKVVHICEATLTKRLIEFENTAAGSLTMDEFTQNAEDFENEMKNCKQSESDLKLPGTTEVVCQHKSSLAQSGFGLCKNCYLEFCGGLDGSEPPAFQRAELARLSKESVESLTESTLGIEPCPKSTNNGNETQYNSQLKVNTKQNDRGSFKEAQDASRNPEKLNKISDNVDTVESSKDSPADVDETSVDETDTLSDIDDSEVSCYLHNKEESRLKKIIWERMNKEYMQEQAAKEAAAAAARKLYTGTSEEIREAQALAAAAAEAVATKKERDKKKRELEAKNAKPAQTAAEAAGQLFTKKKLSSKINYDVLKNIFDDDEPSMKKNRVDDENVESSNKGKDTNDMDYNDDEIEGDDDEHQVNGYGYDYDGDEAYVEY